jgi:hypothetical protein
MPDTTSGSNAAWTPSCVAWDFPHARDKSRNCKQVVVGSVLDRDGIPNAHEVFEGNTQGRASLDAMLDALEKRTGPIHREIYATLRIPVEVMKPTKTWHQKTASDEKTSAAENIGYPYFLMYFSGS